MTIIRQSHARSGLNPTLATLVAGAFWALVAPAADARDGIIGHVDIPEIIVGSDPPRSDAGGNGHYIGGLTGTFSGGDWDIEPLFRPGGLGQSGSDSADGGIGQSIFGAPFDTLDSPLGAPRIEPPSGSVVGSSPVPTPGAGVLLMLGVGAGALRRRRR